MKQKHIFIVNINDLMLTTAILFVAYLLCYILYKAEISQVSSTAMSIYILAVLLVSRFTTGYLYGILSSMIGTIAVNYAFTYPYFTFDMSISGYPITFFTMFTVSIVVCMLTAQIKHQSKIQAEIETEKNRTNLLRSISHDIRTPLTSIIGSSSAFLENNNLTDKDKNLLISDIKNEAEWLIRMVENILSITRMNNATALLEKKPEMLEEIIGETVQKFKKQFPGIMLNITVPDNLLFVPVDVTLIEQVILNILENAVYHGITTKKINISVTENNNFAIIRISDNGVGINQQNLNKLKHGEYVADSNSGPDIKRNMGIGLSVCKSIIKAHGGTITAHNKNEGGAVFEFTLPLSEEDESKKHKKHLTK